MKPGIDYNEYYQRYIVLANDKALIPALKSGLETTRAFFKSIPDNKQDYRYEEGKWTPKEVLLHLIDTERVFAYRALQFARATNVVLIGFDQDEFANTARPVTRTIDDLLLEYTAVREASILFAASCSEETMSRKGVASNSPLSVAAALYIICGHEVHHSAIIKERYL
ncbi:MAG: DinB family protein [Bacteroidetes bacterium]|nr:DinB family protein [Bacteroidota bacterium]